MFNINCWNNSRAFIDPKFSNQIIKKSSNKWKRKTLPVCGWLSFKLCLHVLYSSEGRGRGFNFNFLFYFHRSRKFQIEGGWFRVPVKLGVVLKILHTCTLLRVNHESLNWNNKKCRWHYDGDIHKSDDKSSSL